jgi:hypothetical protein
MKKVIYGVLAFLPALAFAASKVDITFLTGITDTLKTVIAALIPIFFGLAVVYFFWGLIQYIRSAGDPKKASEGKSIMIYGIIAIAVMASIWGIVGWLQGVVGLNGATAITPPSVTGL